MGLMKLFILWMMFFSTLALIRLYLLPINLAIPNNPVSATGYFAYTKGINCICDVRIECDGNNLVNTTLVGWRWNGNNSRWCG
jgi:hypothetical protein